jgi:YHS domain-containing protein
MKTTILSSLALVLLSACDPETTAPASPAAAKAAAALPDGVKAYPLDTCLVSGEKLGDMGDAVVIIYQGQQVKFCCDSCVPKFNKDPKRYLAKLKK